MSATDKIFLYKGQPGIEHLRFCAGPLAEAAAHRATADPTGSMLQYGEPLGYLPFRKHLAAFLSKHYGDTISWKNLMSTAGASWGLWFITLRFFPPGSTVIVEDPTYFYAVQMFNQDMKYHIVAVDMDDEGINANSLEKALIENKERLDNSGGSFSALLYLIPTFHNPSSVSVSPERCRQLMSLAAKYNLLVFCDDVYNLLNFVDPAPKRLFLYDDPQKPRVISNGSFSKILAPGIRLGWIEAHESLLDHMKKSPTLMTGGNHSQYSSSLVCSLMELGHMDTIYMRMKNQCKESAEAVSNTLKKELPSGCSFKVPQGGFFIWLVLPQHIVASTFLEYLDQKSSITALPGQRCSNEGNFKNCIRISFSLYAKDILQEAVEKMCRHLQEFILNQKE